MDDVDDTDRDDVDVDAIDEDDGYDANDNCALKCLKALRLLADIEVRIASVEKLRWRWHPIAASAATNTWTIPTSAGSAGILAGWALRGTPGQLRTHLGPPPQHWARAWA